MRRQRPRSDASSPWHLLSGKSGLAIMISVMGINLLGDGLRDALDPRLRV
jgi:ABC-type dipeptide/oligopeptide/nickel transport system permease subunit